MAVRVQLRRGTSSQNDSFTGAAGEVTVDTTNQTLRVHDGSTAGGHALSPLTDGDKGDITVASGGASWSIDALLLVRLKLQTMQSLLQSLPTPL